MKKIYMYYNLHIKLLCLKLKLIFKFQKYIFYCNFFIYFKIITRVIVS